MRFISATTALILMGLMVGCATFQRGESVVKYERGSPTRMAEAPADGRYALYSGTDLRNPQVQYSLNRGDRLGFVERDGAVIAVAGNNEERIETGTMTRSYFWRKLD
jgi:hypothetical protein